MSATCLHLHPQNAVVSVELTLDAVRAWAGLSQLAHAAATVPMPAALRLDSMRKNACQLVLLALRPLTYMRQHT